jgi:hypothetical protein
MWRIKLGGLDGPQVLFLRPAPAATYLEPYLNEPSDDEVVQLKARFTNPVDVGFPYLRGGRGRGALLRIRNEADLRAVREVVTGRARAGTAG